MSAKQSLGSLWTVAERIEPWARSLALLAARLYLLDVFFRAGLIKLQDWESTLFLFTEEYKVPFLPPELAAWVGTGGELVFSALVALGLLTRPAALGLFVVNAMAVISYPGIGDAGMKDHILWGVLTMALVLFGPGRIALDHWLMPWLSRQLDRPHARRDGA